MRLAFMGTPAFAAASLVELIAAGHEIAAVYTREAKPSGRGRKLAPSPVQQIADAEGIEVRTPKGFKRSDVREAFAALKVDAAIVVAYGVILPGEALAAPRLGCFNLHASLLPRWRGAAPIQRAIMAGDRATGVQVMRMEEGLDTGPILLSETVEIRDDDTAASLHDRLSLVGAQLLPRFLSALSRGGLVETPQAADGVTYAAKISPAEAKIDWSRPARDVDCHIRGLSPFPGAWFEAKGERVKALMSRAQSGQGAPGEILGTHDGLVIACGEGAVELRKLQRAGKSAQEAAIFLRGFPLQKGERL
ncbi:MAG: methionyl-tRNA formyltransferase [Alphaproteobacteria bacterium RIFCSPHIGHO2_12_FULL_63_12]|nr:MAG: methionyl-tRNA formyltransferase [Alphaproteobacteria bacterium RIFCSPHIGHO2_12_FULL_63_12]